MLVVAPSLLGPYLNGPLTTWQNRLTTDDATPVVVPAFDVGGGAREGILQLLLLAADPTGNGSYAVAFLQVLLARSESGTITLALLSGPATWNFLPNAPPWNTMPGVGAAMNGSTLELTFTGLAGTNVEFSYSELLLAGNLFPS